jgi:glycerophosphoryl diester phosphodiesterase
MLVAFALAELVAAQVLIPLTAGVVNWMVRRSGHYAIANEDLIRFFLSWVGLATLLVAGTVTLAIDGMGRGAMMLALRRAERDKQASGVLAFIDALRREGVIVELAARKVLLAGVLGLPFVAAIGLVVWVTVRGVDVYWLVNERPLRFWIALACVVPVGVVGIRMVARRLLGWSLALPLHVLSGRRPRAAMRESRDAIGARLPSLAIARGVWVVLSGSVGIGVLLLARVLAEGLLHSTAEHLRTTAVLAGCVLVVYALIVFSVVLITAMGDALIVDAAWCRYTPGDLSPGVLGKLPGVQVQRRKHRIVLLLLLGFGVGVAALGSLGLLESARREITIEITAHRGASSLAPENTLAAIRAAVKLGVDRIEIDAMLSADGAVVLFHDTDLRRIAGDPRRVSEMTLAELRRVDAGSWFSGEFAGERVPTLAEAIAEAGSRTRLNIELKSSGGDEALLAERVAEAFGGSAGGLARGVIVSALSPRALVEMRRVAPGVPVGLIVAASVGDLRRADVDFLAVESRLATRDFLERADRAGMPLYVWGVGDDAAFTRLALTGVRGVITSDAAGMLARRAELGKLSETERLLLAIRERMLDRGQSPVSWRILSQ